MADAPLLLDDFLPYRLSIASNAVSERIAREYRGRFGLTNAEWRLMAVLGQGAALTQRALVDATLLDKVTVNRAAKALSARALIEREPHADDGRSHLLRLSALGADLYRQIIPAALRLEAHLVEQLGADDATQLMQLLRRVAGAVRGDG